MDIQYLLPRTGRDTYRVDDSDDLVLMENLGKLPSGSVCLQDHSLFVFCTAGKVQFEYDGRVIKLQKNDLFLYLPHCVASNFMSSSDFNCRQIWLTRNELGNIDMYTSNSVSDLSLFKLYPIVHLTDVEVKLLDTYFRLMCDKMKSSTSALTPVIVRSLFGTMLLELLAILRHNSEIQLERDMQEGPNSSFHKRRIVDQFMKLAELSDGRIRRVDEFASQLNITPKYLSSVLKEVMSVRPSFVIQHYTMMSIQRRLRFTDMTMQEISNDLKFPNASFFGKYFKERMGLTPLEYRAKYYQGEFKKKSEQ